MSRLLLVLALLLSLSGTGLAGIYKWVDEQGKVHFGDSPPPEQGAEVVRTAPAPDAEDVQRSREKLDRLLQQQQTSARQRERAEQDRREAQAAARRESEDRDRRCAIAKNNLRNLRWADGVYRTDGKGNRQFIGNKSRIEEIERATQQVEQYCD